MLRTASLTDVVICAIDCARSHWDFIKIRSVSPGRSLATRSSLVDCFALYPSSRIELTETHAASLCGGRIFPRILYVAEFHR
jgi:hypothetical protein